MLPGAMSRRYRLVVTKICWPKRYSDHEIITGFLSELEETENSFLYCSMKALSSLVYWYALQVAYLASSLFLDHNSDLIILVVNTLTQDLKSENYLTGRLLLKWCTGPTTPCGLRSLVPFASLLMGLVWGCSLHSPDSHMQADWPGPHHGGAAGCHRAGGPSKGAGAQKGRDGAAPLPAARSGA